MNIFQDSALYPERFILKQSHLVHLYSLFYLVTGWIGTWIDPYWALYSFFILINCLCFAGTFYLAYVITEGITASFLSVLATTLQWQWGHALGGSAPLGVGPFPDQLATGILLFAIAYFLRKKYHISFFLVGLVFCVHASFSLFVGFMFFFACLFNGESKNLPKYLLTALLFVSPMLIYMAINSMPAAAINFNEWLHLVRLVVSGHTMPSSFGVHYLAFIPYVLILLYLYLVTYIKKTDDIILMVYAIGILCVIGTVFVELIPIRQIIQLTLFRSTRFVVIFSAILWFGYLFRNWGLVSNFHKHLAFLMSLFMILGSPPGLLCCVLLAMITRLDTQRFRHEHCKPAT